MMKLLFGTHFPVIEAVKVFFQDNFHPRARSDENSQKPIHISSNKLSEQAFFVELHTSYKSEMLSQGFKE